MNSPIISIGSLLANNMIINPIRVHVLVNWNEYLRPSFSVKRVRMIIPAIVDMKKID